MRESEIEALVSREKNRGKRAALFAAEEARGETCKSLSFAQAMFSGNFQPDFLDPFPEEPKEERESQKHFIESFCVYLRENLDPDEVDRTGEIPKRVLDEMAKRGVFALKISKKYGGLGFSQTNYNRLISRVSSYCASTAVLISAHQSIGVPQPLQRYGTEAQKKKFLPLFREGKISAFALTEPGAGSDPAKLASTATLSQEGSHYILNGTKLWCTNGPIADYIVVIAKTAPKEMKGRQKRKSQLSAFIVDMRLEGIAVTHRCQFMGLSGIHNGQLRFENVKIPAENLLGREGEGLKLALATINVGRLTLPAACCGMAKKLLSIARDWGKNRVQWGMPVGLHEAGREKIAYIAATTFAMDALARFTSLSQDQNRFDLRVEAAMAKMFSTESLWSIADQTLQLRGGRGYEKASSLLARGEVGHPVERMLRDCRIQTILEGSTEIMKLFLTREAIDPHFKRFAPLLKKGGAAQKLGLGIRALASSLVWLTKQTFRSWITPVYSHWGPFAKTIRFCDRHSHRAACSLLCYMGRYREGLEKKQMILGRLMEINTEIVLMVATCAYAKKLGTKEAAKLAEHFCNLAKGRVKTLRRALRNNTDRTANEVAEGVLEGGAIFLEEGIF